MIPNCLFLAVCTFLPGLDAVGQETRPQSNDVSSTAKYILGVYNVEDILQIPNTKWIVGGGITGYGPGFKDQVITKNFLHLFNADTETGRRVEPSDIEIRPNGDVWPETAPPDWDVFSPHGIAFGPRKGDRITLYACNHGGRESVEAFEIDISGQTPTFAWIGCVVCQKDFWPDAVAVLPDGSLVVNSTGDPTEDPKEAVQKQSKGEPIGDTRVWSMQRGWSTDLPGSEKVSTPNGILVSPNGQQVFIAASSNFSIVRIDRSTQPPVVKSVDVGGIPDNLRWSADGKSMLAGVHTADAMKFVEAMVAAAKVGGNTPTPFKIVRIDAETLEVTEVLPSGVYATMGGGTGAIEVGDRLWVSSTKADRIAVFDLPN
jgi:hypothetical protein